MALELALNIGWMPNVQEPDPSFSVLVPDSETLEVVRWLAFLLEFSSQRFQAFQFIKRHDNDKNSRIISGLCFDTVARVSVFRVRFLPLMT